MDVKDYVGALEQQIKDTALEQPHDHVPRHKADNDYLAGTINNSYKLDSREHRLYAEQIKVNQERNK